jgi:hypothetical protein
MIAHEKGRGDHVARPLTHIPMSSAGCPTGFPDDHSLTVSGCNIAQVIAYRKCAADLFKGFSGHEHLARHG